MNLAFVKDALKAAENKGIEEGIAKAKEEFNKKSEAAKEAAKAKKAQEDAIKSKQEASEELKKWEDRHRDLNDKK